MAEYRTHSFNKDWHEKVEQFIKENDLAFDSPKYFLKFCANKYMDEYDSDRQELKSKYEQLRHIADKLDVDLE